MKNKFTPDFWVQVGILIVMGIGGLGGVVAFSLDHFPSRSELNAVKESVAVEREERHEMKAEMDIMYKLNVPDELRKPLVHPHVIGEKE